MLPSTAAPSPGAFEQAFRDAAAAGATGVVCINLSSKLSATIQAAETAAKAMAGELPVRAVDSKSVSLGLGTICIEAAKAGARGASVDEIVALAEDMAGRTRIHATLDTLENLKKGGRIGAAKALMGSILSVKPVIEVVDGAVEPGPKVRTRAKALQYLIDRINAEPRGREPGRPPRRRPRRRAVPRGPGAPLPPRAHRRRPVGGGRRNPHRSPYHRGGLPGAGLGKQDRFDRTKSMQLGQVIGGRYRLRHQIARGGMAEVWEATDDVLGRSVAVKVLLPELASDPAFTERFRREAISAARLAHPNVVATFDTGVDGDLAFIVMELVDARTLKDVLVERGPLPAHEATTLAAQVAGALHYAHEAGIVHRDVKPANILICPDGRVKVADFGIAKAALPDAAFADYDLTGTGMVVGTAKYLSPEQFEGKPVDRRSDVYALGVVLYEMLCGRPPFVGATDMAIGIQHVDSKPLSPRQVRAGIPRPLEAVVMRAMAKKADGRYPTADALQSALLSVDLRTDDAVPMVVREDTPPRGIPRQTFAQSERSWLVPTVLIVVVAITLGIVGVMFSRTDTGQRLLGDEPGTGAGGGGDTSSAVTISSVTSFDPDGDGEEHEDEVGHLIDGDPATTWRTSNYDGENFAGIKPGVGFVLTLDTAVALESIELVGTSRDFDAEVAVADAPRTTRAGWGEAVATDEGVGTDATLDLDGRSGIAILVWITNPTSNAIHIGEVRVTST